MVAMGADVTKSKKFKKLVRERMAETGEAYTQARMRLIEEHMRNTSWTDEELRAADALDSPEQFIVPKGQP